jgi:hypothetical protein
VKEVASAGGGWKCFELCLVTGNYDSSVCNTKALFSLTRYIIIIITIIIIIIIIIRLLSQAFSSWLFS